VTTSEKALRVLFVDDDPAIGGVLRRYFAHTGVQAESVTSGKAARLCVGNTQYDCVVVDLVLNERGITSGLDLIADIRKLRPNIKIVVLSGHANPQTTQQAKDKGAHDVLLKATPLHEVRRVIEELVAG